MNDQQKRMRKYLEEVATHKYPTICIVQDYVTGHKAPTSWNEVYVTILSHAQDPYLQKIMSPDDMKVRRKTGNLYWRVNGGGTNHGHCVKEKMEKAFNIDLTGFHIQVL